jgi:hypothetical protein
MDRLGSRCTGPDARGLNFASRPLRRGRVSPRRFFNFLLPPFPPSICFHFFFLPPLPPIYFSFPNFLAPLLYTPLCPFVPPPPFLPFFPPLVRFGGRPLVPAEPTRGWRQSSRAGPEREGVQLSGCAEQTLGVLLTSTAGQISDAKAVERAAIAPRDWETS